MNSKRRIALLFLGKLKPVSCCIYLLSFCLFLFSCKTTNCYQQSLAESKFTYLNHYGPSNTVFEIKDNVKVESTNGKIFSSSRIYWQNCNEFILKIEFIEPNSYLSVGDSLQVKILSLDKDTLSYNSTGKYGVVTSKAVRIRK